MTRLGSVWVYGRSPSSWQGLADALFAREYAGQLVASLSPAAIVHSAGVRVGFLATEMTPLGLTFGLVGLAGAVAWAPSRRLGLAIALVVMAVLFAPVSDQLVIGTHLPVILCALLLAIAWGLSLVALDALGRQIAWIGLGLTVVAAGVSFAQHRQAAVLDYTTDRLGDRIVASASDLVRQQGSDAVTLAETWGPRYFAFAFGKWVTGALSETRLLDVRADLSGLPPADQISGTLVTTQDLLYLIPPAKWSAKLGHPVVVESAGEGLVALRAAPRLGEIPGGGSDSQPPQPPAPIPFLTPNVAVNPSFWPTSRDGADKTGILVVGAVATFAPDGDVYLRVEWQAERKPPADYHVYVHVLHHMEIGGPILGQADRSAPVYGFSPTSTWSPGQRVRDDYRVMHPVRRAAEFELMPHFVVFGLYRDAGNGQTEKLSRVVVEVPWDPETGRPNAPTFSTPPLAPTTMQP